MIATTKKAQPMTKEQEARRNTLLIRFLNPEKPATKLERAAISMDSVAPGVLMEIPTEFLDKALNATETYLDARDRMIETMEVFTAWKLR